MIVKPSLLQVGTHPVSQGLVWAAAPGRDTPYEAVNGGLVSLGNSASLDAASPHGFSLLSPDATNGGVYYPFSELLRTITDKLTVLVWANITAMTNWSSILVIPFYTSGGGEPYTVLALQREEATSNLYFGFADTGTTRRSVVSDTGAVQTSDGWAMYAVTRDGSTVRFYRNGKPHGANKTISSNSIGWLSRNISLANGSSYSPGQGFEGKLPLAMIYNRALSDDEIALLFAFPYIWTSEADFRLLSFIPSSNVTGTISETDENDSSAISGTTTVTGSLAETEDSDVSAITGTTTVTGSLAETEDDDAAAISGSVGSEATGTIAVTDTDDATAITGTTTIVGILSETEDDDAIAATGTTTVTGTIAETEDDDSPAISGTVGDAVSGSIAFTDEADAVSANGTTTVIGSLSEVEDPDTSEILGTTVIVGIISITDAEDILSAAGFTSNPGSISYTDSDDYGSFYGISGNESPMSGGSAIVDVPKKRTKRKKREEEKPPVSQEPREITEEEAKGMAAIYGAPFRDAVAEPVPEEAQEEAVISQDFEEIIAKSAILEPITATPIEPEVQKIDEIQEEEDDIALILAIIEAIG